MHIIEQFAAGKAGNEALNEDLVVVTPDFVALLDGATNRTGSTLEGKTLGRFASHVLAETLATLPADITARAAVDHLSAALLARTQQAGDAEGHDFSKDMYAPASAALIYSRMRREIWRVADSSFIVDDAPANMYSFAQEHVWCALRRVLIQAKLVRGLSEADLLADDSTWDVLVPLIQSGAVFANSAHAHAHPYGFGVINGSHVPDRYVEVFDVAGAREIVFASDGYPEIFSTLAATEAALHQTLAQDPLMYKIHPQVKGMRKGWQSFDDRSYVRFSVEKS